MGNFFTKGSGAGSEDEWNHVMGRAAQEHKTAPPKSGHTITPSSLRRHKPWRNVQTEKLLKREVPLKEKLNVRVEFFSPLGLLLICAGLFIAVLVALIQLFLF